MSNFANTTCINAKETKSLTASNHYAMPSAEKPKK